jgi:hypothetical protein
VSSPPAEKALVKEGPTAELPHREEPAEDALLSTQEIEVTTADTMPLPDDLVIDTLPGVDRPVASGSVSATPSARLGSRASRNAVVSARGNVRKR